MIILMTKEEEAASLQKLYKFNKHAIDRADFGVRTRVMHRDDYLDVVTNQSVVFRICFSEKGVHEMKKIHEAAKIKKIDLCDESAETKQMWLDLVNGVL